MSDCKRCHRKADHATEECCSSHQVVLCHRCYRLTHFVGICDCSTCKKRGEVRQVPDPKRMPPEQSGLLRVLNGPWPFVAPTPVGEGWGWGSRLIEIATTPLGIVFWTCVWIDRAVMWPIRRAIGGKQR